MSDGARLDDDEKATHTIGTLGGPHRDSDEFSTTEAVELEPHDREALTRCLQLLALDPEWAEFIEAKLKNGSWREAARFAAFSCQTDCLALRPWEHPPCWGGTVEADALVARLAAAGLSKFEPDPVGALARAERPPPAPPPKRPRR